MKREHKNIEDTRLPATILGGFLGSGKTTLLRHILQSKQHKLKCAVIVNDMAELNIDKSLIQSDGVIQSEEVISMQNGCICCTLSGDLVDQIIQLVKGKNQTSFDYLLIEASGVSEPKAIAQLFAECKNDHDHTVAHEKDTVLSDVVRLDTCVTVVDSAAFLPVLFDVNPSEDKEKERLPQIMVEQIEYSDIILLNKTDLVSDGQLERIQHDIQLLNDRASIVTCKHSNIDVHRVLNTRLYRPEDFGLEATISRKLQKMSAQEEKSCCKASIARGESPCCKRARTIKSANSQVLLANKKQGKTRHNKEYGISSFVYQARKPFHPDRFKYDYINKYFVYVAEEEEEDEDEEVQEEDTTEAETEEDAKEGKKENAPAGAIKEVEKGNETSAQDKEGAKVNNAEEKELTLRARQQEAVSKHSIRSEELGMLLRSKGCLWMANTHDLQGFVSQAANMVTLDSFGVWNALKSKAWSGTEEEKKELRQHWSQPWGDRRQELVFIGKDLNHTAIQKVLDSCLLTDEEFAMGLDGWKATMGDVFLNQWGDHDRDDHDGADEVAGGESSEEKPNKE